ncbi:hypothetical protein SLS60_007219 [Paraconiothyrium brasiliense]|uniref:Uncharacterized protein n=1 Tax=Paraconiothyrium brasiliense TaxID=300254 RepID=A0ABR3R8U1_9PLEO
MAKPNPLGPKSPGRILAEATSILAGATQTSRSDPQPGARRRKPYLDDLTEDESIRTENTSFKPTPDDADAISRRIRMEMPDETQKLIPTTLRAQSRNSPSLDEPDANDPSRFAEHYISLAPLPQYQDFDTTAYLLSKDHRNKKNTSKLEVPILYKGYDKVTDTTARVTLFLIAEKCQFLDKCMAELFQALLPSLSINFVGHLLGRAKDMIAKSDPSQSSTRDIPSLESLSSREIYLGELGHHLESICKGEPQEFMIHRVGEQRLDYLQDALELPYWDLIVDLFESASATKRASGISQTIMENAVGGCYQFIKSHLKHIRNRYIEGHVDEAIPERILEGIALRLRVLEQYSQAIDPLRPMDDMSFVEIGKNQNKSKTEEPVAGNQGKVLTFSILFVVLAVAMVPGMIGFAKATQDGEIGSMSDADYTIVIRDTIMTTLGAVLSIVQMFGSPRKSSAYTMAWVFSGLAISLSVTAVIMYPLANKAYSSLCGFFAQFFSVASLGILVLDGPELTGKGCAT